MAEIEFWRERNATLSALHEQTKLPVVKKVMDVIREADSMVVTNLQSVLTGLFKLHMEASDNVRFLATVERHFKVGITPKGVSPQSNSSSGRTWLQDGAWLLFCLVLF